jgi:excisionase family DNA binding protein
VSTGPVDLIERAIGEALRNALPGVLDDLAKMGGPRAYSVAEVADRLGVTEPTVRKLIHEGHLATVPHLSPTRISAVVLAEYLEGKAS